MIRTLDPESGTLTPLAGMWDESGMIDGAGAVARFAMPYSMVVNLQGELVITDFGNNRIRVVGLDGHVSTLAGDGTAGFADGATTAAKFNEPQGLTIDASGDLYVSDTANYRVRRIRGASVETIAGNGQPGYLDDDDNLSAKLYGLEGISVSLDGAILYVADGTRGEEVPFNRVRSVKLH